jgi:hypothetical protein
LSEASVRLSGGTSPVADPQAVRRRATVALVANLVVLCLLGLVSVIGAVAAARGRALAPTDPVRAQRCVHWAWLLLATNLLLYVLLLGVGILVLLPAFLAAR